MPLTHALLDRYAAEQEPHLFHVTPAERLPALLADGLRPGCESQFDPRLLRPGCVYLCNRALAEGPGCKDFEWGDAIVRVELAALDPALFIADEENWRSLGPDGLTDSYFHSNLDQAAVNLLATFPQMDTAEMLWRDLNGHFASIAYQAPIPASAIQVELQPVRPDLLPRGY